MDEPTAGIDPVARAATWEILAELARTGTTILMATHHLDEAERCHRIGFLNEGKLIASASPAELKERCAPKSGAVTLSAALASILSEDEAA